MGAVFRQLSSPPPPWRPWPRAPRPLERLCSQVRWCGRRQGQPWPKSLPAGSTCLHSLGSLPLGSVWPPRAAARPLKKPRKHHTSSRKLLRGQHTGVAASPSHAPNSRTRTELRGPASGQRPDESQTCLRHLGPAICIPPHPSPPAQLGVNLQAEISLFD